MDNDMGKVGDPKSAFVMALYSDEALERYDSPRGVKKVQLLLIKAPSTDQVHCDPKIHLLARSLGYSPCVSVRCGGSC